MNETNQVSKTFKWRRITATYAPDQELARDGALTGLLPTLPPLSLLDVQVVGVETTQGHFTVRLRIFN
jgi:hypothetical protein